VSAGDRVTVRVIEVKLDKQQIALSMRSGAEISRAPSDRAPNNNGPRDNRGSGFRDNRGGGFRDNRGGGFRDNQGPRPPLPAPGPKKPFNNPFAGLDKLRGK
jgi:hypothetical protein